MLTQGRIRRTETGRKSRDAVPIDQRKSMTREIRLLLVEDLATDADLSVHELNKAGLLCTVCRVETESDFLDALQSFSPDVILCDFSLPRFDGTTALALVRERCPHVPLIFVSGTIGEEVAVESL